MPITDTWPLGRCSTPRTGTTRYLPRCSGGSATRLSSPAPIVTEIAYLLQIELGPAVKAAFLDALARSALIVKATTTRSQAHGIGPNYAVAQCIAP